jgi:hypothetical protein
MKRFLTVISSTFVIGLLLVPVFSFNTLNDSPQKWEKLGQRKVNFKLDRDAIHVTGFEGFFTALQVKVKDGPVNMHKMEVYFHNGQTKEIELRNDFTAGSESRVIDLPGNARIIDKVVFWYDTKNFADSKAIVELWGRH